MKEIKTKTKLLPARWQLAHPVIHTEEAYGGWPAAVTDMSPHYFYLRSHTTEFEAVTGDEPGSKKSWKSFEHFKRVWKPTTSRWTLNHSLDYRFWAPDPYSPANFVSYPVDDLYCYKGILNPARFGSDEFAPQTFFDPLYTPQSDPKNGAFILLPSNYSDLEKAAMQSMLPLIKAELSLANSLFELKDIKSLVSTVSKNIKIFNAQFLTGLFHRKSSATAKELVRSGADNYLQWKFNLAPLISDIASVKRAISRTVSRLNDLIARSGRPQHRHYRYVWMESSSESVSYAYTIDIPEYEVSQPQISWREATPQHCKTHMTSYPEPTEFHAEIEYNYNYTQFQRENARLLAFQDAVGLNFNPAIIWNALPWSFVIDWVFGIGQWLSQFTIHHLEPKINIRRYLISITRKRTITTSIDRIGVFSKWGTTNGIPLPTMYEKAYRRFVTWPSLSSIQSSGLNSQEFTLGSALVVSRRRRPRK